MAAGVAGHFVNHSLANLEGVRADGDGNIEYWVRNMAGDALALWGAFEVLYMPA